MHSTTFICIYLHLYALTFIHLHLPTLIRTDLHLSAFTYTNTHSPSFICIRTRLHSSAFTYTRMHSHTLICIYLHLYALTFIHLHLPSLIHNYLPSSAFTSPALIRIDLHSSVFTFTNTFHLHLPSHRYVSGVLKDDHFVSARSLASDPSPRGLFQP